MSETESSPSQKQKVSIPPELEKLNLTSKELAEWEKLNLTSEELASSRIKLILSGVAAGNLKIDQVIQLIETWRVKKSAIAKPPKSEPMAPIVKAAEEGKIPPTATAGSRPPGPPPPRRA